MLSPRYARNALILLMLINLVNNIDRLVINMLAEPIKHDLHLADWQVGVMTGFAFAILLGILGLPIARLADRGNRPAIIASTLAIWSAFTVLCGTAHGFVQLCLYRVGVGVGEAGASPPAQSLIVDYTSKEKRASALGFFAIGVPLASLLGLPMAGLIADRYGWRAAFFVAGGPGLLLAVIAAISLRETRSRLRSDIAANKAMQISTRHALALLAASRTFRLITAAFTIKAVVSFGQQAFIASFFLRSHGSEVARLAASVGLKPIGFLGLALGVLAGGGGAISVTLGGWLADRAAARNVGHLMTPPALALAVQFPVFIMALMTHSAVVGLALLAVPYLLNSVPYPAIYATTQGIVPPNLRSTALAVQNFLAVLVGLGFGPLLAGVVSDALNHGLGLAPDQSLRWSLIAFSFLSLPCVALLLMTRRTIAEDLIS